MSTVWKVVLALALVLPVGAFVAGSLASSSADEPAQRESVILEQAPQERSPKPDPVRKKPVPPQQEDDDADDAPVVIAPAPASNDDWDDDDRDDRGDDDRDDGDDDDEGDDGDDGDD